ncbi:MAG: Undecaprenyl-phosphate 4-deoxy-4-formamido-L-arabinose transferase [Anaerolineales bacterium]|nr:Undecaprenyl-phosphate 4-deoxy-4-formamido-L-arabinose transferase [Anaerolineales bacterium]
MLHSRGRRVLHLLPSPALTPFLSIVIPAHNEATRLPHTLEQALAFLKTQPYDSEILVVENGSADRTFDIAQEFARRHLALRALRETERGKGRAVQRGMLEARGQYRFMCDADLSMSIEQLPYFLPPASHADIVIASREAKGAQRVDEPLYRHLGGRLINLGIRLLILPRLNDTQCGFKCFTAEAAEKIFPRQTLPGWSFDIEVLYLARRFGFAIREIPIRWRFDAATKLSAVPDALRMLRDIFRIHANALRGKYDSA